MKAFATMLRVALFSFILGSGNLFAESLAHLDGSWELRVHKKPEQTQVIQLNSMSPDVDLGDLAQNPVLHFYASDAVFVHLYGDMTAPQKQLIPTPRFLFTEYQGHDVLVLYSENNGQLEATEYVKVLGFDGGVISLGSENLEKNKVYATLTKVDS
ncbi:MAG: hypothetical protein HRU09_06530 [Oligoflexales bacterium]|nr:hypothetical protein [Oligoflexales bacterium]